MGRGRRPVPTEIKELQGNPGHRPLNDQEPKPDKGEPEMPKGMWPAARREWKKIVPLLEQLGVLSVVDGKALAAYCEAYALWEMARVEVNKYGLLVEETSTDKQGVTHITRKANPAVNIKLAAAKEMKSFLIEFGLTPASRAKLKVEKPKPADPMEKFMAGRTAPEPKQTPEEMAAELSEEDLKRIM